MPHYVKFNDYLAINGVDLSSYIFEVTISPRLNYQETTSGSGAFVTRIPTTIDYTLSLSIRYDPSKADILLPLLGVGVKTVVYGPEGNAVGKPKHHQDFIFAESGMRGGSAKLNQQRHFQIVANAALAPICNMYRPDFF